jgi:UDP-galactopyranose mutase
MSEPSSGASASPPKVLVVGTGLFGATVAERCASELDCRVIVVEKRPHVGGNSYSAPDPDTGIEVHRYGSHIFHTDREPVWQYVNRFAEFNDYRHTVWARHGNGTYSLPVNLATINQFFRAEMGPEEARALVAQQAAEAGVAVPRNMEEKAVSMMGRPLYEAFIEGYTTKQWGTSPRHLPASIIERLPIRFTYDNRYFDDPRQGIPVRGYGELVRRMLDHPRIEPRLNTDYFETRNELPRHDMLVFTGPLDRFFEYRSGALSWRTLRFEWERPECADFQGASVINHVDLEVPFTRVHEFRHFVTDCPCKERTVIAREFSEAARPGEDPYYPVRGARDMEVLGAYQREAARLGPRIMFGGRLGGYAYLDMDDAIHQAFECFERIRECLKSRASAS